MPSFWLSDGALARLLRPAEWVFRVLAGLRRRWLSRRAIPVGVPVIIVGSIFVGGSGKTPLVIWLAERARMQGYRPGIVTRGYGGSGRGCHRVRADSDPAVVGDEAVMIARMAGVPVVTGRDRVAAVNKLVATGECDLVIADDGLQHYRLDRDVEIVVLDGARGVGNGRCLPAGPLREPAGRLSEVALVVTNGPRRGDQATSGFELAASSPLSVAGGGDKRRAPIAGDRVHAVAGIGDPERFFQALERLGFSVTRHAFPDHHAFKARDLSFTDKRCVLMTAKDAIKCEPFDDGRLWFVPVRLVPDEHLVAATDAMLANLRGGPE